MSDIGPSDEQIYASCAKFDASVKEEASLILWNVWRHTRPRYSTLQACLEVLTGDNELHEALHEAHILRKYDEIRDWSHSLGVSAPISQDLTTEAEVGNFLKEIEHGIGQFINGQISLPTWSPEDASMDSNIRCHLHKLQIPVLGGKPNLLLHELGSFKNDPSLYKRLNNIFKPNHHTFLVNTSGSGKTRLLLEGLCDNWGFYFTSMVDSSSLGSSDVQKSIQSHIPTTPTFSSNLPPVNANNYNTALKRNREIASAVFRRIFLARLLVFSLFVELMERPRGRHASSGVYRLRWLTLQIQPNLVHSKIWDIFDYLSCLLSQASDCYVYTQTNEVLKRIRKVCASDSSAGVGGTPFFCVLDEAQYAATQHMTSFRSDQNGCHRPILREIVRAWKEQSSGHGVFMVVAGTGISKDVVDQAIASAIMKGSNYRWCSDTGAFDQVEVQRRYLEKYLPRNLLESDSGGRLLDRIWYWLHGRHRFTAAYVMELMQNGFRQPHRLLNAYVHHFTDFTITDACDYVEAEEQGPLPNLSQLKPDFSKLKKNSDMLTTIHQVTTRYLMRSITVPLGGDEAMYVQYGFARFLDSDTQTVAVDEPLIILAATKWMTINHQSSYKMLAREISTHCPTFNGFEDYTAFCIDLVFSQKRKLNEVFTFCGPTQPAWADMEAQLVAMHRNNNFSRTETGAACFYKSAAPSVTLGINAKSPEMTLSWLQHQLDSPFCFPHHSMGPDMMFVLRLSDRSLIWVAVQTKWSRGTNGALAKKLLLQAMQSNDQPYSPSALPHLRDDIFQALRDLPDRRTDAGEYSVLRVVASYPALTRMNRYIERDADVGKHPIATLNMDLIKQLTRKLPPHDFLELQAMESTSSVRGGKKDLKRKKTPKRESERRKKIKLN